MKEKDLSYYIKKSKLLDKEKSKHIDIKIGILSNFTIKGLKEIFNVKCHELSLCSKLYEAGYNQINQEFIDKNSGLCIFKPNITFLLINPGYIIEEDFINSNKEQRTDFIKTKIDEFFHLIFMFLENISGILVISNLIQFSYSPLGIIEEKTEMSRRDMIDYFNKRLKHEFINNYRVFIYNFNSFFIKFGEYNIVNEKLRYLGDFFVSPDYLPLLGKDLMSFIKSYASKIKKCIVLDLDNTLWGGIIGEDGFNNIKLDNKPPGNSFMDFQKYLLALNKRGIILAINSKNNPDEALKVIREHSYMVLKEENFASIKINWDNKVNNMLEIAKELNIGIDSLVFIDDDPVNRELIKEMIPEVLVIDLPKDSSLYVKTLKELTDFNTFQLTDEDFKKAEMYNQQKKRTQLKKKVKDLESFLKDLNIEIEIKKANEFTIPRISQLTKKTNQFNLATKRYTEENINEFTKSSEYLVYSVSVKDKFGDNGLTGAFIIHKRSTEEWEIDTFLLSCRVIGRNIENVMLYSILNKAKNEGIKKIIGKYIPTEKNTLVKDFYKINNFKKIDDSSYELEDFNVIKKPNFIELIGNI